MQTENTSTDIFVSEIIQRNAICIDTTRHVIELLKRRIRKRVMVDDIVSYDDLLQVYSDAR